MALFGISSERKKVIREFGDKLGFVYFGNVDQHTDDHRAVRGFSVSLTHKDSSYMVGSYEGQDVTFVDRADVYGKKSMRWLICDITLGKDAISHFFLVPTHQKDVHYNKIFSAVRGFEPLDLSLHDKEFSQRYEIHCSPVHIQEMEEILTPELTRTIAAHFWPLAIEVWDGTLFVYSAEPTLTQHHLDTIIKNGTWLAQVLTSRS